MIILVVNMKNKIILYLLGLILILIVSISISYAYFTANFEDAETIDTITISGGKMKIAYNGGANIKVNNIIPTNDPVSIKIFTITGDNTTPFDMNYQVNLVVESNTFSESAIKYKLISENTSNNGAVIPDTDNLNNIGTGAKIISLGHGIFTSPTGGSKIHTYTLEIYFLNAPYIQDDDKEKEINAYITVETYVDPCKEENCLKNKILSQDGGEITIRAKGNPDFSKVAVSQSTYVLLPETGEEGSLIKSVATVENGLYATVDDYGVSYYYRGDKEYLNNNLLFGGFQWKIIRINGDSSIRLIYNGTEEEFNQNETMNDVGENTQIDLSAWNVTYNNDAKYVGYMYGGANGVASTVRNGTTSVVATYNETSTNVKTVLDNWYQTNISDKSFESQVVNNLFCNDRQLESEVGGVATGPGHGNTGVYINYAAYYRLIDYKTPTLKCGLKNDRFTTSADTTIGNGALTYPIGLITADEAALAGLVNGKTNTTNYLYTSKNWWLLSPGSSGGNAYVFFVYLPGYLGNNAVNYSNGVRASISLTSDTIVSGTGTTTDPFRVI